MVGELMKSSNLKSVMECSKHSQTMALNLLASASDALIRLNKSKEMEKINLSPLSAMALKVIQFPQGITSALI